MTITIVVKAGCKENKVEYIDSIYYVYTKSKAKEGKANESVITLLSEHFNVMKSCIRIKSGLRFKKKVIEITS